MIYTIGAWWWTAFIWAAVIAVIVTIIVLRNKGMLARKKRKSSIKIMGIWEILLIIACAAIVVGVAVTSYIRKNGVKALAIAVVTVRIATPANTPVSPIKIR